MVRWLGILLRTLGSAVRTRREFALENLALRQQLAVWKLSRLWKKVDVRRLLQSDPDTLIAGYGRAGVAECAATEPGPGGGGPAREWASSRIPATHGLTRSDESVRGRHNPERPCSPAELSA